MCESVCISCWRLFKHIWISVENKAAKLSLFSDFSSENNIVMADQFCLRWNNFQTNIVSALDSLKCSEDLVDVTLTCEGRNIKAHKVILSACSPYFRNVFKVNDLIHYNLHVNTNTSIFWRILPNCYIMKL